MFYISPGSDIRLSTKLPSRSAYLTDKSEFIERALRSIYRTSRTAKGKSNTDVSPDKPDLLLTESDRQITVDRNSRAALEMLFSYPEIVLDTASKVAQLVAVVALSCNRDLTEKTRNFWRTWETPFNQTPATQIKPEFRNIFCSKFSELFQASNTDPIEFAYWIERYGNTRLHPFTDGCGRTTRILSTWILARASLGAPLFESIDELFAVLSDEHSSGLKSYAQAVKKSI